MGRRSKYGAVPTVLDGFRFDSKGEARRWAELKLLERGGKIQALIRQPEFALHVGVIALGRWRGDFGYIENGTPIFEDYKGVDNALSRWKRRHVEAEHGITVRITGAAAPKPRKRAA